MLTLPPDTAIEQAFLGCVLSNPLEAFAHLRDFPDIKDCFADDRHTFIFEAIEEIVEAGEKWNAPFIESRLASRNRLFEDAHSLIMSLFTIGVLSGPEATRDYAARLHTLQMRRRRIEGAVMLQSAEKAGDSEAVAEALRIIAEANLPAKGRRDSLTVRNPNAILGMQFDESDRILGDRLGAIGQSLTILGAGGIGKSRLLLQLAVAQISERRFLDLETHGRPLRWLIIQGENSNRRMQFDLVNLQKWAAADWDAVNEHLTIHTLESDTDAFMNLDNPENYLRLSELIQSVSPDVVCFDTLNCFAAGDLNKDSEMLDTCMHISRLSREGNPHRAIVVLHHALTGKAGAVKATGFDRASFGRNSKVLQAWTRGQINISAGSEDDNGTLVFSCGKCSNGREFEPFAARLNERTMIYEVDSSFQLDQWKADVSGTKPAATVPLELVKECCQGAMTKAQLAKAVMAETGCARSLAYRKVDAAEGAKIIHFTKAHRTYVAA